MKKENVLLRKEQCPACASKGNDTSKDNLAVYSDGQTHCFACGNHTGYGSKEALGGVKVKKIDDSWLADYQGEFFSLPEVVYKALEIVSSQANQKHIKLSGLIAHSS